jgi:hypothetical protein
MAPKEPRELEGIGRIGKAGLLLVSDRTPSQEWESFSRQSPKPTRERLGPVRSGETRARKCSRKEVEE